jgi:hypothetical protein
LAGNHAVNDKSKHIRVRYHKVRELSEEGILEVVKVASADNLADITTKALPNSVFRELRKRIFE